MEEWKIERGIPLPDEKTDKASPRDDAQLVHQTVLAFDQSILDNLRGKTPASASVKLEITRHKKHSVAGRYDYSAEDRSLSSDRGNREPSTD